MNKDVLFLLEPGFFDGEEGPYFCPHTAAMEGLIKWVPEIEEHVEVRRIAFQRPRPEVVRLLGKENQGTPVLVLGEGREVPGEALVSESTGRAYLLGEMAIGRFLARDMGIMKPH